MDQRLIDKVAVVVGGGQFPGEGLGNGRAISIMLARHGAKVMVAARHLDRAQATVDMITKEGGTASAIEMNVVHENECKALMDACVKKFGKINILVYNTGINPRADFKSDTMTDDDWDDAFHINLRGDLFCCRHAIPYMIEQGKGSIINISSDSGVVVTKQKSISLMTYSMTKRAMNCLTENLAAQYAADGIRVNAIILGPIDTPMGIDGCKDVMSSFGIDTSQTATVRGILDQVVPLKGGQGTPWDTAYAVLFLASDESKFITGCFLNVDGGVSVLRGS